MEKQVENTFENAIEIKNLTKHYPDFCLNDLTLTLPAGCIMGLVGENGAGKTTTIKLLLDIIKKDSGTIRLLGTEDSALAREDIGVVMDDVGFPHTMNAAQVGNIMRYICKNWEQDTYENFVSRFGLPKNKEFKDYSRGMKMKLGIAVALSHQPKLLILDEATSGLDPVVRDEILDVFLDFTREKNHSILISSHIVSDLEKICDYIAFIHEGKLMLLEEKDALYEEFGMVRMSEEDFAQLDPASVRGKRKTRYGVEAIVKRDAVPEEIDVGPIDIEELFIFMVKEAR